MIIKPKKKAMYIHKLEALQRRLKKDHPKRKDVLETLARQIAGYNGEKSLDYFLNLLPNENYLTLHNLRLMDRSFFQMDILLLSPFYFLILEVKNMSGTLTFDPDFHQLIRTFEDKEEAFPCPIAQVERQAIQLQNWLKQHNFSNIPIEKLVVISNPHTIIKTTSNRRKIAETVLHSASLIEKIHSIEKKNVDVRYSNKELRKLGKLLMKNDTPLERDVMQLFQLTKKDVLPGAFCENCSFTMLRIKGKWFCNRCLNESKHAHVQALIDYSLLFGVKINNQQAREFLQLSSIHVAKRLLMDMNVEYVGEKKARKYILPNVFPN